MKDGNCRNCGAPPDGSGQCPYCGTRRRNRRLHSGKEYYAGGILVYSEEYGEDKAISEVKYETV